MRNRGNVKNDLFSGRIYSFFISDFLLCRGPYQIITRLNKLRFGNQSLSTIYISSLNTSARCNFIKMNMQEKFLYRLEAFFNIFVFEQLHEKYEHSSRREKRRRQLENHERPWADLGHGAAII